MRNATTANKKPDESPDAIPTEPATRAVHDFANSEAMRVLREWATSPEIEAIRSEIAPAPADITK